jgi:hypothetical protein
LVAATYRYFGATLLVAVLIDVLSKRKRTTV